MVTVVGDLALALLLAVVAGCVVAYGLWFVAKSAEWLEGMRAHPIPLTTPKRAIIGIASAFHALTRRVETRLIMTVTLALLGGTLTTTVLLGPPSDVRRSVLLGTGTPAGNDTGNTVYYVVGTKEELEQKGIVQEEGGARFLFVLWKSGKSLVPARNLDTLAFTAIDKRQVTTIPLPDSTKEYRIVSRQDLSSLATAPDKNGNLQGTVRIAAPHRFWAPSRYLILLEN